MEPEDVELVRIGSSRRRMALVVAALLLALVLAILKPWTGTAPHSRGPDATGGEAVVGVTSRPASPSPTATDQLADLCTSPDGWRVVADDREFGRTVRTWIVAGVELSNSDVMPDVSTIPQTTLPLNGGLTDLGFCAPAGTGSPLQRWTGTLWQVPLGAATADWQFLAALTPSEDALGALTVGPGVPHIGVGTYVIEAHNQGTGREAWLGVVVASDV